MQRCCWVLLRVNKNVHILLHLGKFMTATGTNPLLKRKGWENLIVSGVCE